MNNFLSSSDLNEYLLTKAIIDEVLSNQTEKGCPGILDIFATLHEELPPFMHAQRV
jgi:hypothetical protein